MTLARRLGLTADRQRLVVRLLQLVMVGILLVGLWLQRGGIVINAALGLAVTQLPAYLERNYRFTMNAGIVLWITVAMFLHALGMLPLPGLALSTLYGSTWWWDHLTHALSSSLVAGVGYTVARAVDERTDAITLPSRFLFGYLLVFVMAVGVVWELLEFYVGVVATVLGNEPFLVQFDLDDTVLDLVYNTLGGLLVALFGTAHLTGVAADLASRLEQSRTGR